MVGSLTAPGGLAGLVLLGAGILIAAGRLVAGRTAADHPRSAQHRPQLPAAAPHLRASNPPAGPVQPAVIPQQSSWQSRLGQLSGLVEDRVPGPAALQFEEAIGSRDQQHAVP